MAARNAQIERFRGLPEAMRALPQWLVWRYVRKDPTKKPAKMPYYASGQLRGWPHGKPKDGKPTEGMPQVQQGDPLDRAELVSFDAVIAAFASRQSWDGIGFAFLPGDGLVGVDIDGAIDLETGEVSRRCDLVLRMCPSYAERSVSGTGVHIILSGEVESFKDDDIGLEVYCGRQFFTCTGERWGNAPEQAQPADPEALAVMRGMCEQAKRERDARKAAAAPAPAATGAAQAKRRSEGTDRTEGADDFKRVNQEALRALASWVPELFPKARAYKDGYRVSSKDLGRELQEDLGLLPSGIQDFGAEEKLTAIDVVVKFGCMSVKEALHWLAQRVGVQLTQRRRASARRPEPDGGGGDSQRPEPPPPPIEDGGGAGHGGGGGGGDSDDDGLGQEDADEGDGKAQKRRRRPLTKREQANLLVLKKTFAYQYGTKLAWDTEQLKAIEIANLRHTFGGDVVKLWMASEDRWVVRDHEIAFEPGVDLGKGCINLFKGLPLEPEPGDCSVMIELLRHLCSTSEAPGLGAEEIADWVLRWLALPLQRLGAKMDTALVFHGPQGTGKNLFFDAYRDFFGDYGVMVGQTELEDKYNTWLSGRMLIIGDEVVSRQEMYHGKNRLKWIVTQRTKIPIRAMHADTRWESNHANLVFLSNESQPLVLEDLDRRYLVVYTPAAEDGTLYARVAEFLANGGAAKFMHFLMTLDLQDFDEHTKPPLTVAKQNLIELSYKPAERFMHEWLRGFLDLPMRVCSVEQLYRAFRRWCDATGERFWPTQAQFTSTAGRFAHERVERDEKGCRLPPVIQTKVIQLKVSVAEGGGRRAVRCWVPRKCAPPEPGISEGEWAAAAVKDFEKVVRDFMRRNDRDDDDALGS
ncbi:DUF5906 domain-containing protein [Paucibacter sp. APW11]|uniref:DUF5906 domain-containing protein n=1 Tax=Roseateles aquae TaxID=3077235 RepID=A0ABU3P713_9BURK|nr:DUF5906 domain-containing protein [Paucibacter sp. APW11]MDT8998361.1 DUF5906 domain-containing protein [Paucibacter sp. APW11]